MLPGGIPHHAFPLPFQEGIRGTEPESEKEHSMPEDDVRVPAGWYPDPLGLPQLRWWDNHAWTEHISDAR